MYLPELFRIPLLNFTVATNVLMMSTAFIVLLTVYPVSATCDERWRLRVLISSLLFCYSGYFAF